MGLRLPRPLRLLWPHHLLCLLLLPYAPGAHPGRLPTLDRLPCPASLLRPSPHLLPIIGLGLMTCFRTIDHLTARATFSCGCGPVPLCPPFTVRTAPLRLSNYLLPPAVSRLPSSSLSDGASFVVSSDVERLLLFQFFISPRSFNFCSNGVSNFFEALVLPSIVVLQCVPPTSSVLLSQLRLDWLLACERSSHGNCSASRDSLVSIVGCGVLLIEVRQEFVCLGHMVRTLH